MMFALPKIMVCGAEGQLGYQLLTLAREEGFELIASDRRDLDLRDAEAVSDRLTREQPAFIINAAGSVPREGEQLDETSLHENLQAVDHLASTCHRLNIALIQISCAEVFDGSGNTPRKEDDPVYPHTPYGKSLWALEERVRDRLERHIILRSGWLFSSRPGSLVRRLLESARRSSELKLRDDLIGAPTSAADLSRVIIAMIKQLDCGAQTWGTYHYASAEITTRFGFGEAVIAAARQYEDLPLEQLNPETKAEDNYPRFTGLNCEKIRTTFGIHQRPWRSTLMPVIRNLYI